jgi:hypothetical protein
LGKEPSELDHAEDEQEKERSHHCKFNETRSSVFAPTDYQTHMHPHSRTIRDTQFSNRFRPPDGYDVTWPGAIILQHRPTAVDT